MPIVHWKSKTATTFHAKAGKGRIRLEPGNNELDDEQLASLRSHKAYARLEKSGKLTLPPPAKAPSSKPGAAAPAAAKAPLPWDPNKATDDELLAAAESRGLKVKRGMKRAELVEQLIDFDLAFEETAKK